MNIQTISIVVPTKGCVNACPFCVSRMHDCPYEDKWDEVQMIKRIKYAVMNGVNTCIITGTGEALQNSDFIYKLRNLFQKLQYPFPNVELQTTGVLLNKKEEAFGSKTGNLEYFYPNIDLLKSLGVNTISLSVSSIFSDALNLSTIGVSEKLNFKLEELISFLKDKGFNIRLSLNMLKDYDDYSPKMIIGRCKELGVNQVTFRKMFYKLDNTEGRWTKENKCSDKTLEQIAQYIQGYLSGVNNGHMFVERFISGEGTFLYTLPFGGRVYSIEGMSVVIDNDCMSKENNEALKYIVLRENGKLYCRWDDEGSLIF